MKILLGLIGFGAALGAGLLLAVCLCAKRRFRSEKADCIIVLGARVWPDGRMSNSLVYRCESALGAWKNGVAPDIIVCGGRGNDEPVTEAETMYRWLVEKGVPAQNIHRESESADTRENLRNARQIMDAMGLHTAAICTSDYHLTRALWLSREEKIPASGISARSPSTLRSFIFGRCREAVSWALYFMKLL